MHSRDPVVYFFLFVIPTPDNVSGCSEGSPGDMEPTVTCQEFVGVFTGAKIVDKALKLFGVHFTTCPHDPLVCDGLLTTCWYFGGTSINCQDLCSYMNRCSWVQRYYYSLRHPNIYGFLFLWTHFFFICGFDIYNLFCFVTIS